ncbi:MAG: 2-dehydropantoate 2-reductase [Chloroflexi bacterium]|nr:2-dehydropantoate 2-reductase [Chloroflexota bacterium]MBP7041585.1 2-dehydropantoate 2-reductase [Chloroflexota bacterium]
MTLPILDSVAVLGAGALGAFYASQFYQAGFATTLIARGARYAALQKEGVVVNERPFHIPVTHPDDGYPVDLIIVALKHHHLGEALGDLRPFVGPHTLILSVMNGLDSEEIIGQMVGREKMLYCIAVGIDAVRDGHRVTYSAPGKLFFGEATNAEISPRVQRVQAALARAGLVYETPPDMLRILWWKFMINVGMNQASAVMGAPYGVFQTLPAAQAVMKTLMDEVIALAQCASVNLSDQDITDWYGFLNTLSPQGKTSMLQDMEAGRKTEVEMFGGKVVTLGKTYGIPTPVNETLLRIIQVMEAI